MPTNGGLYVPSIFQSHWFGFGVKKVVAKRSYLITLWTLLQLSVLQTCAFHRLVKSIHTADSPAGTYPKSKCCSQTKNSSRHTMLPCTSRISCSFLALSIHTVRLSLSATSIFSIRSIQTRNLVCPDSIYKSAVLCH